ncbi:50S ribosomal protein L24 [Thermosyntropha sp.]|uniref:50S ribosomal protein L24 n=1 Tax=Thermosyntropha sp. TaxID=2740820 RepID=UPI0025D2E7AE|nr:50S ribosomal protein L24 [Thermosyntropha sp.]MBO8158050.1 50S ribosomal protein L24 [Thermosyntropha sp.]
MRIKKGDNVMVITGKDAGKKGKVLRAFPKEGRVVVEGVNKVKKHQKPSRAVPQGGILKIEAPIHVSNVMLICNKCNRPTRVGAKILDNKEKVRVCKKCGEIID